MVRGEGAGAWAQTTRRTLLGRIFQWYERSIPREKCWASVLERGLAGGLEELGVTSTTTRCQRTSWTIASAGPSSRRSASRRPTCPTCRVAFKEACGQKSAPTAVIKENLGASAGNSWAVKRLSGSSFGWEVAEVGRLPLTAAVDLVTRKSMSGAIIMPGEHWVKTWNTD